MFNNHLQMIEMATPSQLMKDHTTAIAAVKAAISSCARAIVVVTSTGRSVASDIYSLILKKANFFIFFFILVK